jgi:cell division protein ZapA
MEATGRPTQVVIYGKTYQLRGAGDPAELQRLARAVDQKMRFLAPDPAAADGLKVALLAAINFADEAQRIRNEFENREEQIGTVSARLSALLKDCLEEDPAPGASHGARAADEAEEVVSGIQEGHDGSEAPNAFHSLDDPDQSQ